MKFSKKNTNKMKRINKLLLGLLVSMMFFQSCEKGDSTIIHDENNSSKVAIVSDNLKTVQAKLIDTNPNLYVIEVKITNKKTKETLPTFIHKFIPDNPNEIMKDLPRKMNSFNGTFILEVEGQFLLKSIIKNGTVVKSEHNKFVAYHLAKEDYSCTISGIQDCAEDTINDMNWVDYSFCLASAPVCLAQTYASCAWESCK